MGSRDASADLLKRFFEELSETLDLEGTIKKLNMPRAGVRELFRGLASGVDARAGEERAAEGEDAYRAYVDGASRGNPGPAGAGAVIEDPGGRTLRRLKKYLGEATNNVAEYSALIMALEAARSMRVKRLKVLADSELMVKQINRVYKVRSGDLKPLYERAVALCRAFDSFTIEHIYRKDNPEADGLANEAIDKGCDKRG